MKPKRQKAGFTVLELLLVIAVIILLVAILWPIMGAARKATMRTTCASNLRQIGMAYQLYFADYGQYPIPDINGVLGSYIKDKRLLMCPEDTERIAASSYNYRFELPPDLEPLNKMPDVDPNIVLVVCKIHAIRRVASVQNDNPKYEAPQYPHHLVLRANGAVQQIHLDRIKQATFLMDGKPVSMDIYPEEPGYDKAGKRDSRE